MLSLMEILEKLCAVKSPSGFEKEIAEVIASVAKGEGLSCSTDALGNLIVHKPGVGRRVLLDAHMDTTGFLASFIDENGFVRFDALGGLNMCELNNVPIEFLNGTKGTVSYEQKSDIKGRKVSSMFIDIGAKNRDEAKEYVLPGDAAVFAGAFRKLCGNKITSPYLDNKIGCAVLLYVLTRLKECQYDVFGVFSVQEEVGCRGAKTAAFSVDADFSIVIDVTDSCDIPGYDGYGETKMSGGAAIKIMDRAAVAHPTIVSALEETAVKFNIPYLRDIITIGGTDAGNIQLSRAGIPTGGISVPVRYMHSQSEVADVGDIENCAELLLKTLETNAVIL